MCVELFKAVAKGEYIMTKGFIAPLVIPLFFFSGFCNLVYEVIWARMFNLVFGVTVFAISTVLAAFMLGMASGGIVFGRLADRQKNNLALFALVHVGIFVSTLLLLLVFPVCQMAYLAAHNVFDNNFPAIRTVMFLLAILLMIVPTTLMGATFPVAVRLINGAADRVGSDVGTLYSVNTLGSVAGCIAAVFVLLGALGMKGTIVAAAGLDLIIGVFAFAASRAFATEKAAR
jgi:spermidine synthase